MSEVWDEGYKMLWPTTDWKKHMAQPTQYQGYQTEQASFKKVANYSTNSTVGLLETPDINLLSTSASLGG